MAEGKIRAGGREYSARCGLCNHVESGYSPKGYRTVSIDTRSAGGVQMYSESIMVDSDVCEAQWLMRETTKRVRELMGYEE